MEAVAIAFTLLGGKKPCCRAPLKACVLKGACALKQSTPCNFASVFDGKRNGGSGCMEFHTMVRAFRGPQNACRGSWLARGHGSEFIDVGDGGGRIRC